MYRCQCSGQAAALVCVATYANPNNDRHRTCACVPSLFRASECFLLAGSSDRQTLFSPTTIPICIRSGLDLYYNEYFFKNCSNITQRILRHPLAMLHFRFRFTLVLSLAAACLADTQNYQWPSPQYDTLEALLYEGRRGDGSNLASIQHPCRNRPDSNSSIGAEWLRFVSCFLSK
jgi:hypothetical protein